MDNKNINDYKKCPFCDQILSIVLYGFFQKKHLMKFKEENIPFHYIGCCCYGDDRDGAFYCSLCKIKFDKSLNEIKLIDCPRVLDYRIRQEDCCDEIKLKTKYKLKSEKYCAACKKIITNNEEEYREAARIIGLSEEVVEQVVNKKNSNLRLKNNMLYKHYLCEEVEAIHRLKYWDR